MIQEDIKNFLYKQNYIFDHISDFEDIINDPRSWSSIFEDYDLNYKYLKINCITESISIEPNILIRCNQENIRDMFFQKQFYVYDKKSSDKIHTVVLTSYVIKNNIYLLDKDTLPNDVILKHLATFPNHIFPPIIKNYFIIQ